MDRRHCAPGPVTEQYMSGADEVRFVLRQVQRAGHEPPSVHDKRSDERLLVELYH